MSKRTRYSNPPRGYDRGFAQRHYQYERKKGGYKNPMAFKKGRDRTSGYYGRYGEGSTEKKFHDVAVSDPVVAATLTITNLGVIPQGTLENQRIGRKVTVKSVHGKFTNDLNEATATVNSCDQVQLMLIQDTQTNGAQFVATDLLETDDITSFRNLANNKRFKILWSKIAQFSTGGLVASGASIVGSAKACRWIKFNKKMNIPIEYDNAFTDGRIATIRSNNLYFVVVSSSGSTSLLGTVRLRFTDK